MVLGQFIHPNFLSVPAACNGPNVPRSGVKYTRNHISPRMIACREFSIKRPRRRDGNAKGE